MKARLLELLAYCLLAIPLLVRFSAEPWFVKFAMCYGAAMLVRIWIRA